MVDELNSLEIDRIRLKQRKTLLLPLLIGLPILSIILTFQFRIVEPIFVAAALLLTGIIYSLAIGSPFKKIKGKVKTAILGGFMESYHPGLEHSYQQSAANGRNIAKGTGLYRFDSAHEEDVLIGKHLGANFYISELELSRKSGKSSRTVFKGILFELTIPGKDFPNAVIRSGLGEDHNFSNFFGHVKYNPDYNFYFDTDDLQKFEQQLGPLFPFIEHLSKSNGGIKILTQKDRIVIMMNSDMKFLDTPSFDLNKSFFNKEYNTELGKQLNTLLFIVESFANNLEKSEIVERLELKILDTVDKTV